MPRPGQRPYECVRRAWHSPERHQPMRGSIIQQIFRIVTEAHSPATRKNREHREKLPVVVLRAEQIMYSKANSEAEYMNLETLWERLTDATDTIIRRDQSSETGDLLPPCVEAALNLGCVPVRTSRSERHNNPRSYLPPRTQEPRIIAPPNRPSDEPPSQPYERSKCARPDQTSHGVMFPESRENVIKKHKVDATCGYPVLYNNHPFRFNQPNSGSVYPLYYGSQNQYQAPDSAGPDLGSGTILVGRPVGTSNAEAAKIGILQNIFCNSIGSTRKLHGNLSDNKCDLSLRLGLSSELCMSIEGSSTREEDKNTNNPTDSCLQVYKGICYFPRDSYHHQSQFK